MIRPKVLVPTGTRIWLPVFVTIMPRRSPSEDPSAIVVATTQFVAVDSFRSAFQITTHRDHFLAAWRSHATLARAAKSELERVMKSIADLVPQGDFSVPYSTALWVFRKRFA